MGNKALKSNSGDDDGDVSAMTLCFGKVHSDSNTTEHFLGPLQSALSSEEGRSSPRGIIARQHMLKQYKLLHRSRGHSGAVSSIARFGRHFLVSASYDMSIKVWNTSSISALNRSKKQLFPDSRTDFASVETSRACTNEVVESVVPVVATVENAHTKHISVVVAFDDVARDSYRYKFATGGCDGCIKIWGMALIDCASSPYDGREQIECGDSSGRQEVFCIGTISDAHSDAVWRLCALSGGKCLLSTGYKKDCRMRLWDVSTCSCISTITGHSEPTYALLELPNGIIASGGGDELIKLWNFSSYLERADDNNGTTLREAGAACLGVLIEGGSGKVLALECVRDEAARLYGAGDHCYLLLSGNQDSTIRLWGVRLTPSGGVEMDSNLGATSVVVVDVAAACAATDIAKCDFVIDAAELRVEKAILRGHNGEVNCLRAFADGTTLASGSDDKTIRLWDLESRTCVKVLTGHQNWILGLQFLSDDETLVSSSRDHTIGFWQAPRKRFLLTRKMSPRK